MCVCVCVSHLRYDLVHLILRDREPVVFATTVIIEVHVAPDIEGMFGRIVVSAARQRRAGVHVFDGPVLRGWRQLACAVRGRAHL
jgi:hypothetical protein